MRSNADVVGTESTVESKRTFLLGNLGEAVEHAAVRVLAIGTLGLLLQSRLDKVKRQAEEGGEETGDGAGGEGLGSGGQVRVGLELGLGLAEEGELAKVESHGSHHRGCGAGPESSDAFALGYRCECIDDGLVVLAVGEGLEAITLHSDEGQVGRVTNHGSDTSSSETSSRSFREADLSSFLLGLCGEGAHHSIEQAQAGSGIDGLSEKACGQTSVQVKDLSIGNDLSSNGNGRRLGTSGSSLTSELDADLDHVDGLDYAGGDHATEAAVDEGEGSLGQRRSKHVLGNDNRVNPGSTEHVASSSTG